MFKVIVKENEKSFASLDAAMEHAKILNEFVTIKGGGFEIVGKFGVDTVANGKCPDGIDYTWMKRRNS